MRRIRLIRAALGRSRTRELSLEPGTCIECGGEIEPGLAAFGAVACHACRPARPVHTG